MKTMKRRKILGITGGMGSGKSMAAAFLAESAGWHVLDADRECRKLLEPHGPGWLALSKMLGPEFFLPDQTLDRKLLREAIFSDDTLRRRIDAAIHPLAWEAVAKGIDSWRQSVHNAPLAVLVVEVPLLFEANWQDAFDAIIVVYAGQSVCRSRVASRDKVSPDKAAAAVAAQWPLAEKALAADYVIDNSGSVSETCLQLLHLVRLVSEGDKRAENT